MQALAGSMLWVVLMVTLQLLAVNWARTWKWLEPLPPWWEEEKVALRQAREIAEMQAVLLRRFEKTKDAVGCRERAEMWEKLNRTDACSLYNAACYRAVTAAVLKQNPKTLAADAARLAEEEANRAMVWLKQAVAAGYKNAAQHGERSRPGRPAQPGGLQKAGGGASGPPDAVEPHAVRSLYTGNTRSARPVQR